MLLVTVINRKKVECLEVSTNSQRSDLDRNGTDVLLRSCIHKHALHTQELIILKGDCLKSVLETTL